MPFINIPVGAFASAAPGDSMTAPEAPDAEVGKDAVPTDMGCLPAEEYKVDCWNSGPPCCLRSGR